eukprot:scaffold142054_cov51-Prasinocladus_malaysianus.AAC.8
MCRLELSIPENLGTAELMRRQGGNCAACRKQIPMPRGGLLSGTTIPSCHQHHHPPTLFVNFRLPPAMRWPPCADCNGIRLCINCRVMAPTLDSWDFKPYPVSSMAAEFLEAIYEQPMLCIGAVNPGLYARVPLLARVHEKRMRASK